jgi:hypothetical protein
VVIVNGKLVMVEDYQLVNKFIKDKIEGIGGGQSSWVTDYNEFLPDEEVILNWLNNVFR